MKLLRWCFPLVILAFCGFLLLTSAFSPHPAVMRASMLRSISWQLSLMGPRMGGLPGQIVYRVVDVGCSSPD